VSVRQRLGLVALILSGFLILLWGGPGNMTVFESIRAGLYISGGVLAFVWPDVERERQQ